MQRQINRQKLQRPRRYYAPRTSGRTQRRLSRSQTVKAARVVKPRQPASPIDSKKVRRFTSLLVHIAGILSIATFSALALRFLFSIDFFTGAALGLGGYAVLFATICVLESDVFLMALEDALDSRNRFSASLSVSSRARA